MVSGIEGVGEAVTGGMLARAVEPRGRRGGRMAAERPASIAAPRCNGPIAMQCGQKAHVHRSLAAFGHDLVHGVLHFDGKFWRTLPLLAWRPGELTRRYVHGERAKFVSPMALFLFSVFLMFAVLSIYGVSLASLDVSTGGGRARLELEAAARRDRATTSPKRARIAPSSPAASAARIDGRPATRRRHRRGGSPTLERARAPAAGGSSSGDGAISACASTSIDGPAGRGSTTASRRSARIPASRSTSCRPTPTNSPGC